MTQQTDPLPARLAALDRATLQLCWLASGSSGRLQAGGESSADHARGTELYAAVQMVLHERAALLVEMEPQALPTPEDRLLSIRESRLDLEAAARVGVEPPK